MLTSEDLELHAQLGIPASLLEDAQVRRVTTDEARELGIRYSGDLSGIVYPRPDPLTGSCRGYRLRRDHPDVDESGEPVAKYLSSYGDRQHLFFPPGSLPLLDNVAVPVVFVEAEKSLLAIWAGASRLEREVLPIRLVGAGAKGESVSSPMRTVRARWWFASTRTQRPTQRWAKRGARVLITELPPEDGVNGPDDFIGRHGDRALFDLFDTATPYQQPEVEAVLAECGLDALPELEKTARETFPSRDKADVCLTHRGADPLRIAAVREAVIARLKAAKVSGATKLASRGGRSQVSLQRGPTWTMVRKRGSISRSAVASFDSSSNLRSSTNPSSCNVAVPEGPSARRAADRSSSCAGASRGPLELPHTRGAVVGALEALPP